MGSVLEVLTEGHGPRVVFIHGSVLGGDMMFSAQAPLAERWTLARVNRRGFGKSPPAEGEDFEVDAGDIADLIEDGDHLVGFSYGGLGTMMAAARRQDSVASLALIEVPAMDLIRGDEIAQSSIEELTDLRSHHADDYEGFLRAFSQWVGSPGPLPEPLPPPMLEGARLAYRQRPTWEASIPLDDLRTAPFPKLVVRGDGHAMLGKVCDVLEAELGAEGAYVGGLGHMIPFAGPPLNDALESFWTGSSGAP